MEDMSEANQHSDDVVSDPVAESEDRSEPVEQPNIRSARRVRNETPRNQTAGGEPASISLLFFMACILFLAAWFVGPRMVEEYQYASSKGKLRAEYENAVAILEEQPLKKVSMASQLVAHKVKPSVVSIRTRKVGEISDATSGQGWTMNEFMEGFGSGVIMSEDGYIVTNAHVVENSEKIWVELHDRRGYVATEVGRDDISDIAVLKIEADGLIPAQWGDSQNLEVGSFVWAIGSPYRYEQTVTSGIISAKDRRGDPKGRVKNLLQTDAALNKGNSGGPLVNAEGNVVGINTSIFGENFLGISFAVPSATARFVYEQILERGKVVRGFLGVRPRAVSHQFAKRLGLPDLEGALLTRVEPGSPAALAGLQRGDVVRAWNAQAIRSFNSLYRMAERSEPGSQVEVTLIRDGEPYSATVTVGELPLPSSMIKVEVQNE